MSSSTCLASAIPADIVDVAPRKNERATVKAVGMRFWLEAVGLEYPPE
jgi:hypothetical protein